jgi:DNA modification methylase
MMIDMLDQIITGDAKVLAERIPDASIDLIFTDPVYDRIEDYAWLAQTAARVLKPNRACLVWCSNKDQYAVHPAMSEYLRFVCQLTYTKVAKQYRMIGYKTFYWTTPLLWFHNGNRHADHEWLIDTVLDYGNAIISMAAPPSKTYKWHKNPEAYIAWLKAFTKPGDIVYDPFAGSGSLEVECKRMERHFIASEIHADIAAAARERVAQTQVVAPAFQSTQLDLFGAA